ncbi:MAG: hypothetical protein WA843_01940 [Candidatus Saccharimonadales bacterium]
MERNRAQPKAPESLINGCTATPIGRAALRLANEKGCLVDSLALRRELRTQIIEIADAYDSMDHRIGPMGGTDVQNDCQALWELVRSLPAL